MAMVKTDSEERVIAQKELEKHCRVDDAMSKWAKELNDELGPNAEAVLARLYEKYYPDNTDRKLWIRKWDEVTKKAKNRSLGIGM